LRHTVLISCALVALGLAAFLWSTAVYPATVDDATLKGITSLQVFVEGVSPQDKPRGLTRDRIHADVESQLRTAGIAVSARATEYLYVNVNTLQPRQGLYSYSVVVMLRQPAYLVRDPLIMAPAAITWWKGADGIAVAENLQSVRDAVHDLVDKFIHAFREQNPKP
jgi:hypothetical protein